MKTSLPAWAAALACPSVWMPWSASSGSSFRKTSAVTMASPSADLSSWPRASKRLLATSRTGSPVLATAPVLPVPVMP